MCVLTIDIGLSVLRLRCGGDIYQQRAPRIYAKSIHLSCQSDPRKEIYKETARGKGVLLGQLVLAMDMQEDKQEQSRRS